MSEVNYPPISVAMGVRYRREDTSLLRRSIDSILNQTYSNFEFLICENDSTAEAKDLLQYYRHQDSRIKLIDGDGAETLAAKLNRCLFAAQGAYVARMDDDDQSLPERLKKQLSALESCNQSFVGCTAQLWLDGNVVGRRQLPEYPSTEDFLFVQPFLHPALMFKKEALLSVGGYCEASRCDGCEDFDLLLRLYEAGFYGFNLQEDLLIYSISGKRKHTSYRICWNEARTRYVRFHASGLLPKALPYVVKPLLVGLLPNGLLTRLKNQFYHYR